MPVEGTMQSIGTVAGKELSIAVILLVVGTITEIGITILGMMNTEIAVGKGVMTEMMMMIIESVLVEMDIEVATSGMATEVVVTGTIPGGVTTTSEITAAMATGIAQEMHVGMTMIMGSMQMETGGIDRDAVAVEDHR